MNAGNCQGMMMVFVFGAFSLQQHGMPTDR